MATFNFNLRNSKAKNQTPINFIIRWDGNRLVYPTNLKILPEHWDEKKQRASISYLQYPEFNRRLSKLREIAEGSFLGLSNDSGIDVPQTHELRKRLDIDFGRVEDKKHMTLFEFIETHIERTKQSLISKGKFHGRTTVINSYNQTYRLLKEYDKKLTYDKIDLDFYYSFIEYCENEKGFMPNNIGKHIKNLKAFLNEATEQGYNENLAFRSRRFVKPTEDVTNIYLSSDELNELYKHDLSDRPGLTPSRDLFLVGCYTGLRFSDYSILNRHNIEGDFIKITTQKTEHPVIIPIHPIVRKILEKYEYNLPTISNPKINANLKLICERIESLNSEQLVTQTIAGKKVTKKLEKWEMVTSHSARRSFATNAYKMGIPSITIMAITGHKTERAFLNYIKVTPDEHAKIIMSYWKRSQLKAS